MRRAVITGIGIVSCLGNDKASVTESLRNARSGISYREIYKEMGMRSHVAAAPDIDLKEAIDRKQYRFMGDAAAYAYVAMLKAIEDAGLTPDEVSNIRTGIIAGSGGGSTASQGRIGRYPAREGYSSRRTIPGHADDGQHRAAFWPHRFVSRASTIRFHRPAPPARTASATRWN